MHIYRVLRKLRDIHWADTHSDCLSSRQLLGVFFYIQCLLFMICLNTGLHSDSEETSHGNDDPVDSADEFDHFYD